MDCDEYMYGAECEDDYRMWMQAFCQVKKKFIIKKCKIKTLIFVKFQSIGPSSMHNKLFDFAGKTYAHKGVNEVNSF